MTVHTILLRSLRIATPFLSLAIAFGSALADSAASSAAAAPAPPAASAAATPLPSGVDWRALNKLAGQQAKAKDFPGLHDTLGRLAPSMPGSPTIAYKLAATAARLGRDQEALHWLARLADSGLSYDLAKEDDFASLGRRADFDSVRERLAANREPVGTPSRMMAFEADTLPESLAWDARTKRLFVSSVRHCEIRAFEVPGRAPAGTSHGRRFANLPASVFALGLDPERYRLWATIATVPQADGCGEGAPSAERTALLALDLRTGRVLQRVEAGVPGVLGDLLVAEDGTVFVTESTHGAVLRLRPGAQAFDRLDPPGEFVSPQTPALSSDGRTLFVPDYARGIAAIELGACPCTLRWLANGEGVYTAGIDGLVRDGHALVAVQNGTSPPRVIRFASDLSRQQVLESGTPGLGEPTHGIVVGRAFWFISDVGWDRFDDAGRRKAGVPASHPELRRLELGTGMP
jgi:sugar lactone lactonase YvrE